MITKQEMLTAHSPLAQLSPTDKFKQGPVFKHKKLDEISHVLLRPGRYLGSITAHTATTYFVNEETQKIEEKELTWCPGFIKMFDEVISNSVDFSKTKEGAHLTTIKVDIADNGVNGEISVFDDGGIAILKNPEYDQYIPEYIFELRAGSNFDDDDDSTLTGQNGEGAALTNIFSQHFSVKTADGKKEFEQRHSENSRVRSDPKIRTSDKRYTKITYLPDYAKLGMEKLDEGNYAKLVKRVYDVAGCNPKLKVYLNGKQIKIKSFKDYIEFYTADYVFDETDNWKVGIAKSDGFKHVSFVNTTETTIGGVHIKYLQEQITQKLREYFNKKHKIDVKPSEILNHIQLFVDATIIKPRYSSQTKEELITEIRNFGTSFEITEKVIQKLTKSEIIQSVLDWVEAKAAAEERKHLRELNKDTDKMNPNRIPKFCDATEKKDRSKCMLFITEGDTIYENEQLVVYENEKFYDKKISDIQIGDLVLTHKNRLRKVIGISRKVIEGIKITCNEIEHIVSPMHRLLAYDKTAKTIVEVRAKDLDKKNHCLVKSRIVDVNCLARIESVTPIEHEKFNMRINIDQFHSIDSTKTHKFYVWDSSEGKFDLIECQHLDIEKHSMVLSFE